MKGPGVVEVTFRNKGKQEIAWDSVLYLKLKQMAKNKKSLFVNFFLKMPLSHYTA